jgi:transposase
VLSGRARASAKTGDGPVEMLRLFKLAKSSAIKSRSRAINQFEAVLVAPDLLEVRGVGPDTAVDLLTAAGDNPDRLVREASFAALCGVSPVEASSGKTSRRRLNRGGNHQANGALYRIVLCRLR